MRTWRIIDGERRRTTCGIMWSCLKRNVSRYPFNDDQVTLFDHPSSHTPQPRASRFGKNRRERMERAVRFLQAGWTLRTSDRYSLDIGFNGGTMTVRFATRCLEELYEVAVEMRATITCAGEIDWRHTETTSEDFYAY